MTVLRAVISGRIAASKRNWSTLSRPLRLWLQTTQPCQMHFTEWGARLEPVEMLVCKAGSEDPKFIAFCPFVNAQCAKNPNWTDAFNVW